MKALASKTYDIMCEWEISSQRTKHSNHLAKSQAQWLQLAMHLAVGTPAKIFQIWVFRRIPAANAQNKWFRQRLMQNIHRAVPLQEDEGFFVCSNHFGKKLILGDLKVGNMHLFPCSGNPYTTIIRLHRQYYLSASITKQTIFALQILYFSSRILPASNSAKTIFLTGLNSYRDNLFSLLQSRDRQS